MEALNNSGQTVRLLTEHDVAKILRMSVATIRHWRLVPCGPRWLKLGYSVRYRQEDVKAYIEELVRDARL